MPSAATWYLSFDCATKTFAFSLSRVDPAAFHAGRERLKRQTLASREVVRRATEAAERGDMRQAAALAAEARAAVDALSCETARLLTLADGATVDLFPGRRDSDISTVERLRAVSRYVRDRVLPAARLHVPEGERMRVIIEYQMGHNARARAVSAALVTLFAEHDVALVGPTLKNKVAVCESGRYANFAERYSTLYGANKAHAKYNFERVEETFGSRIPAMSPPSLRGHVADSFMQVLGFIAHGPATDADKYF